MLLLGRPISLQGLPSQLLSTNDNNRLTNSTEGVYDLTNRELYSSFLTPVVLSRVDYIRYQQEHVTASDYLKVVNRSTLALLLSQLQVEVNEQKMMRPGVSR